MKAWVALGSNLGDRHAYLEAGLEALRGLGSLIPSPRVMETPDESGRGPSYLNTVALLDAEATDPRRLLEALLQIELDLGRDRTAGRNAPRTLDLDLIAAEGWQGVWQWPSPAGLRVLGDYLTLELPHPRARQRPFVLEPLRALIPEGLAGLEGDFNSRS